MSLKRSKHGKINLNFLKNLLREKLMRKYKKLLFSTAALGLFAVTMNVDAATSSLQSCSKKITLTSDAPLYTDSTLKSKSSKKKGTVYCVDGYRMINKVKYYRVYQDKYAGYIADKYVTDLKGASASKKITVKAENSYTLWKNFYFKEKVGSTKQGANYEVKTIYKLGNGNTYYSLYQTDKDNKSVWKGYVNASATKDLTSTSYNKKVTTTKEYTMWKNLYFSQKNGTTKAGQVYEAKLYYTDGKGTKYYSLYQTDKNNKSVWKGYVNGGCLKDLPSKAINKKVKVIKDNYGIHKNFYWTQKVDTSKTYLNQVLNAKREYTLGDGKVYYSIYDSKDKWLGYLGAGATELYTEPTEYGKEIPKVTTLFKNNDIKIWDKPVDGKKEVGTSKEYYDNDTLITYDRESDDKNWVKVSVDGKALGWVEKSELYTNASLVESQQVKLNDGGTILYQHPGLTYKYESGDKKGQDRVSYYSQKEWDKEYPYSGQIVTLKAKVTDGNTVYYKVQTPGISEQLKSDTYWIQRKFLNAETSNDKFYNKYETNDVKDGRKYFSTPNIDIWKYPCTKDGINISVAKTGDFIDDYIFVDKEINIDGKVYQHILVNTADIGWVEKTAFKTNELKAINSSLTGIDRNENTFTGNPNSPDPIPEGQNEKWINWNTSRAYAYGLDKDGYEIDPKNIKGTLIDTTKRGQSFNFTLSAINSSATAKAIANVRKDTGVQGNKDVLASFDDQYIVDNSAYCIKEPTLLTEYGQSQSYGRKETGSDNKTYQTWVEYQQHVHNYQATGFGGNTVFSTQLFTPNYISKTGVSAPTMTNPQSVTVMGDNIYSIYPKDNAKDYTRGVIVRYDKSLSTDAKETLRTLNKIWDKSPSDFKRIVNEISVSPEITIGHGQGLANDGKNLYILDNSEQKDESKNSYQTNTLIRVNAATMIPEQLSTYRYIQRFGNDDGTAWSKTYSNNLAWKPGTNIFYTMYQHDADHYIYEIQEHKIQTDGSITTTVKFRIKNPIGSFKLKDSSRLPIQGISYDSKNDAIVLLGDGQYQAFSGNQQTAKVAYVGNLNDEYRESEGIAYDGENIYLQVKGGPEILAAKNIY